MTTTLVVRAHSDPGSFTWAWADATVAAAGSAGHELFETRLPRDFAPVEPGDATGGDIAAEVEKILAADRIVLHFPLWWFAPPASLKGWCDGALAHGPIHSSAHVFDTGRLLGTEVLFCVSTGAPEAECGPDGREGDTRLLLWPLAQTFRFCGATVLEPRVVHGVLGPRSGREAEHQRHRLARVLAAHAGLYAEWAGLPRWPMNADADFGPDGRLLPGAPSHDPFIRHRDDGLTGPGSADAG